jgi:hypothetical protein
MSSSEAGPRALDNVRRPIFREISEISPALHHTRSDGTNAAQIDHRFWSL